MLLSAGEGGQFGQAAGDSQQSRVCAMSIAVMNWIWTNSPTPGNERLVLLALVDACSRDDGTGCWPSAATIARKAIIGPEACHRSVWRVITCSSTSSDADELQ